MTTTPETLTTQSGPPPRSRRERASTTRHTWKGTGDDDDNGSRSDDLEQGTVEADGAGVLRGPEQDGAERRALGRREPLRRGRLHLSWVQALRACAHADALRAYEQRTARENGLASESEIDCHLAGLRADHDATAAALRRRRYESLFPVDEFETATAHTVGGG
jgi:hypothetical protein